MEKIEIEVPGVIVPANFQMDPATDDLIRSNSLLEGMVVLIEDISRESPLQHELDPEHECDQHKCVRLLRESRWCRVSSIVRRNGLISFIGVYADGTKRSRTYNQSYCWFVKKDEN